MLVSMSGLVLRGGRLLSLFAGDGDMAAMAQNFEVVEVIKTCHQPVAARERLNMVDLQSQFVASVGAFGDWIFLDLRRLEIAALTGPFGAATGSPSSRGPKVITLECPRVFIGTVGGATPSQWAPTAR